MTGTLSNILVTDPLYVLFVDETGSSTNMRKDKTGGKKVIAEKGYSGTQQAISSNIRYTTMGFTAATGEPVMCVIIFTNESKKGIPGNWLTGIDITKIDTTFEIPDDKEEFRKNRNRRYEVQVQRNRRTLLGAILTTRWYYSFHSNCLKIMDELDLFPRENNKQPFNLDFLKYIRDDNHPWSVVIGLPYGTHLWQVGDSHAQNGNYKHYEQQFKDILFKEKISRHMSLTLKPTDVVPIVNHAWERSFAVVKNNLGTWVVPSQSSLGGAP